MTLKYSFLFLILNIIFIQYGTAQLPENINEPQSKEEYDAFNRLIATQYAPEFRHQIEVRDDVDPLGMRDLFVSFDFDGDWNMKNNWGSYAKLINESPKPDEIINMDILDPEIYYMVTWFECEWMISYTFFHAMDWNDCDIDVMFPVNLAIEKIYDSFDRHENDTEGCVVYVSRETFEIIELTTIFHNTTRTSFDPITVKDTQTPIVEVDNQTHSAVPWGMETNASFFQAGCHTGSNFHIDYTLAAPNEEPFLDYTNKHGKYVLTDIFAPDELFSRRCDSLVMNRKGKIIGDDGASKNMAKAPWAYPFIDLCTPKPSKKSACKKDENPIVFNQCGKCEEEEEKKGKKRKQ